MVVSFSLIGSVSNSYAEVGDFITSFDGADNEGIELVNPRALAVDNNDRIIVCDAYLDVIRIYDSEGNFDFSISGVDGDGIRFLAPYSVAVDNDHRIIVADIGRALVQVYDYEGKFDFSFD